MTTQREQDYIAIARQYNRAIWEALQGLIGLQSEWTALDYATTLDEGTGPNEGLAAADIGAVVFDTADAMRTLLQSGHATNMAKLL